MEIKTFKTDYAGTELIIETGRMAHQAGFALTARMGDTVVMSTVTMSENPRPGMDFFPLMIDYEERYYAVGQIKGSRYNKREGRPPSESILIGRMIDRGLRPLFPQNMRNDVQVIIMPLSLDNVNKPDIVGMLAACCALHCSDVPFDGPVAGVRIGKLDGEFVVNTPAEEIERSDVELVVIGDGERISMVDCSAKDQPDNVMVEGFQKAIEAMGPIAKFFDEVREQIGKPKRTMEEVHTRDSFTDEEQAVVDMIKEISIPELDKYLFNVPVGSKGERKKALQGLKDKAKEQVVAKLTGDGKTEEEAEGIFAKVMDIFYYDFIEEQVTKEILDNDKRVDGRKLTECRKLVAETGFLPRCHGTGLFSRGETQIMSVVTLGSPGDGQLIETMELDTEKRYMHHYNFPPYSVGEVKPLRGAGRREIGHGALAEKAIIPVLPVEIDFPYTVRVASEVMGSNGSSSMGSTCGSTLALMDAGVPISKHVGGIAMGLASDGERWKVLTDLQDLEDGNGGMDFKITGTRDGITAIQMDTKTRGLDMEIVKAAMTQGRDALNEIIGVLEEAIPEPNELSPYAPRIISFMIDPERIGEIIGPGGKVIKEMTETFGVQIDIEDDGSVHITSDDPEQAKATEDRIRSILRVIEIGDVFEEAEVVRILNFGAFVKLTPSTDGLLHISEIAYERVENVEDKVNIGDKINVKVIKIDRGKVNVSMRALLPKPEGWVDKPPRRDDRRGGDRRGGRRDDRRGGDRRGGDRRGGDRRSGDKKNYGGPPKEKRY